MVYIRATRLKQKEIKRSKGWIGYYNNEHPTGKEVVQLNKNGDFLCVFESMSVAAFKTKVNITSISKCCNSKAHRNTAGGYCWRFASDYFVTEQ